MTGLLTLNVEAGLFACLLVHPHQICTLPLLTSFTLLTSISSPPKSAQTQPKTIFSRLWPDSPPANPPCHSLGSHHTCLTAVQGHPDFICGACVSPRVGIVSVCGEADAHIVGAGRELWGENAQQAAMLQLRHVQLSASLRARESGTLETSLRMLTERTVMDSHYTETSLPLTPHRLENELAWNFSLTG